MRYLLFVFILIFVTTLECSAQKFYLGNYLLPTENEFEYLGTSSKTRVSTYRYKKNIYDKFFGRKIGDIIVGVKNNYITTTIYNLIPEQGDVGVPADVRKNIENNFPFPFKEINGVYGLNVDNETISFSRVSNALTFWKDRIMFMTSIKQSILENSNK